MTSNIEGPWRLDEENLAIHFRPYSGGIALHPDTPDVLEVARLIKAAPKLLSALEAVANGMMQTQGFIPYFMEEAIKEAREGVKNEHTSISS